MYSSSGYPLLLRDEYRLCRGISSFSFLALFPVEVVLERVGSELAGDILIGGILLSMMLSDFPEPDFFFVQVSFFPPLVSFLLFGL